ncbi:ABC transporter substrate-binding protein [Nostoc sp. C052]|uniref:caspase, EACC1-associated type n=1 Tax=Nostoc sp. C052 TaxID=2576902 RepID=UPI0015C34A17|nr:ABC transporter substrate-binding protein [Nostoc sp. C052]QLE43716.1 ABC transporter substrate-binding protein [Nostoc sp. C052]
MAKVALLIAVSEYEPGLTPLPSTIKDIEAMQRVLGDPEIGGFEVKSLLNPDNLEMQTAIENLFLDRQRDDIVLLYFSGHGIKYDSGKLYFATKITRRNEKGELFKASTVSADFVHDIINDSRSRSRRQVIILDCCFSGAFANETKSRDDVSLDFQKIQLGGEGRAVLTSSTSIQYSFESIYTQYLVQGIETGEADENNDGFISVDELHQYVQRKVQENNHEMKPQIQAVIKEGYNIVLTKAPIHNRESIYLGIVRNWVRDGQISDIGRLALNEQQNRLEIESDKAVAIEEEVLKPYKEYQRKLQQYKEAFDRAVQKENPITEHTRRELIGFQRVLRLTDEDINRLEAAIIANLTTKKKHKFTTNTANKKLLQFIGLVVIAVVILVLGKLILSISLTSKSCQDMKNTPRTGLEISYGGQILQTDTNSCKKAGTQAFASGNYNDALNNFNLSLQKNPNDPETLIYRNNAKARQKGERLKIAVSVPMGANPNVAGEMLRGVAQAQDEVNNSSSGINGKFLEVAIANDDNEPNQASNIATQFVKDTSIRSVVGHNASHAAVSAAHVYQQEHLVMLSPTSFDDSLSKIGNYIFRIFTINDLAKRLSNYISNTAAKTNIVICFDAESPDNNSFQKEFTKAIDQTKTTINPTSCNLSDSNFDPNKMISQARSSGADSLFLAPDVQRIDKALKVVKANQGQFSLFSSPTMYTQQTLADKEADVNGMVLAVPWHPQAIPGNPFPQDAQKLWGGPVNWRTATSYDATKAIIAGLQKSNSNTREELQNTLHSPNFSVDGTTGKIQFSESGDRKNNPSFLVKVQQKAGTEQYEFVPIEP